MAMTLKPIGFSFILIYYYFCSPFLIHQKKRGEERIFQAKEEPKKLNNNQPISHFKWTILHAVHSLIKQKSKRFFSFSP